MNSLPLPFRAHLHHANEDEIARANATQQREPATRFLPVADEIRDMASRADRFDEERLDAWAHHPDESVPIMFLTSQGKHLNFDEARLFLDRALDEADRENVVWTPLLDRIAASESWAGGHSVRMPGTGPTDGRPWPVTPKERLEALVPWLEDMREPERLAGLLSFRYQDVWKLTARHAGALSASQVTTMSAWFPLVGEMASNPRVLGEHIQALASSALTALTKEHFGGGRSPKDILMFLVTQTDHPIPETVFLSLKETLGKSDRGSMDALRILLKSPYTPLAILLELTNLAKGNPAYTSDLLFHANAGDILWDVACTDDMTDHMVLLLLRSELINDHQRLFLFDRFGHRDEVLKAVAIFPQTPLALLRRIASRHRSFSVRQMLAGNPRARQDFETCEHLLKTSSADVLSTVADDPEIAATHFETIIQRIAAENPTSAAAAIHRRIQAGRSFSLAPEALAPLLEHEQKSVREAGLLALGGGRPNEQRRTQKVRGR